MPNIWLYPPTFFLPPPCLGISLPLRRGVLFFSCFFLVFGSLLASGEQGLSQLAFHLALTQQVLSSDSRPLNS